MKARFQFRLRTLLIAVAVVAVACAYVGWQAKLVHERRAWMNDHALNLPKANPFADDPPRKPAIHGDRNLTPSLIRRWLGDEDIDSLTFESVSDATVDSAKALFPEADIYRWSP